ncbi:putative WRKY transcription factor 41 [Curcuma longa]|uniref:putative WRKY transcription factor 41 n=1 Tax=Curcuma longa TaxID=136217 RepID=UPI003D9DCCB8
MGSGEGVEHGTPLMAELARALQLVRELESHLAHSTPADSCKSLAPEILYSIQKSILMVQSSSLDSDGAPPSTTGDSPCPPSEGHDCKQMKKNRNTLHKWTTQVRLIPGGAGGVEGPVDDGYSWRKYGQKDILGAKHPRAYYRCTNRNTQSCPATKQVQRSDEDPLLFNITYRGIHSCLRRPHKDSASEEQQNQRKKVKTERLDSEEASLSMTSMAAWEEMPPEIFSLLSADDDVLIGSSTLLSPATLDSTYFLMSPYPINEETSDSDLGEKISRANSASNSSLVDMDFMLDELNLDQSFQFDASSFFS